MYLFYYVVRVPNLQFLPTNLTFLAVLRFYIQTTFHYHCYGPFTFFCLKLYTYFMHIYADHQKLFFHCHYPVYLLQDHNGRRGRWERNQHDIGYNFIRKLAIIKFEILVTFLAQYSPTFLNIAQKKKSLYHISILSFHPNSCNPRKDYAKE